MPAGFPFLVAAYIVVWVGLLAVIFLRERIGLVQVGAIALLLLSQVVLGAKGVPVLGPAALLILGATLLWSVEVVIAKVVLPELGAIAGATGRMAIGGALLLGYLAVSGRAASLAHLGATQWGWAAATSVLLLLYVVTWYGLALTLLCIFAVYARQRLKELENGPRQS